MNGTITNFFKNRKHKLISINPTSFKDLQQSHHCWWTQTKVLPYDMNTVTQIPDSLFHALVHTVHENK